MLPVARAPWSGSVASGPKRRERGRGREQLHVRGERAAPARRPRAERPCRCRRRRRTGRSPAAARRATSRLCSALQTPPAARRRLRNEQESAQHEQQSRDIVRRGSPSSSPGIIHVYGQSCGHRAPSRAGGGAANARRRPPWSSAAAASPAASTRSAPCAPSTCSRSTAPSTTSTSTSAPAPAPSSPAMLANGVTPDEMMQVINERVPSELEDLDLDKVLKPNYLGFLEKAAVLPLRTLELARSLVRIGELLGDRRRRRPRRGAAHRPLLRRRRRRLRRERARRSRPQQRLPPARPRALPHRDRPRHLRADRLRRGGLGRRADLEGDPVLDRAADRLQAGRAEGPPAGRRRHPLDHQRRHRGREGGEVHRRRQPARPLRQRLREDDPDRSSAPASAASPTWACRRSPTRPSA